MKITLCGSTRFIDEYNEQNKRLTLQGHTVYSVVMAKEHDNFTADEKLRLDAVHMAKIMNSDAIFVINKDGYVGESTQREIYFAEAVGKQIIYLQPPYSVGSRAS